MEGLLNIRKKRGERSFDIVMKVRDLSGEKRVGHTGILDEFALGVLVVLVGRATKLARFLIEDEKEYVGTVRLGASTDTDDSTGRVVSRGDPSKITERAFRGVAESFTGEIEQIPPMYSCVRFDGTRLHKLARRGVRVDPPARRVTVETMEVLEFRESEAIIRVVCSKGTYMRALARDIGERLGCLGHLHDLVRLRVGDNLLENSIDIDSVCEIEKHVTTMNDALGRYPIVTLASREILSLRNGLKVPVDSGVRPLCGQTLRVCDNEGELVGMGTLEGGLLTSLRILG